MAYITYLNNHEGGSDTTVRKHQIDAAELTNKNFNHMNTFILDQITHMKSYFMSLVSPRII